MGLFIIIIMMRLLADADDLNGISRIIVDFGIIIIVVIIIHSYYGYYSYYGYTNINTTNFIDYYIDYIDYIDYDDNDVDNVINPFIIVLIIILMDLYDYFLNADTFNNPLVIFFSFLLILHDITFSIPLIYFSFPITLIFLDNFVLY